MPVAALSAVSAGMLVTDADGVVRWVNAAMLESMGCGEVDVLGKDLLGLGASLGLGIGTGALDAWKVVSSGTVWSGEIVTRGPGGEARHAEQTFAPVRDSGGRLVQVVGIRLDRPPFRPAELDLRESLARVNSQLESRAAELASAHRELELFAYAVSHDLRAPLRAIDFFGRELSEHAGPVLDETARGYLDRVLAARRRMLLMIEGLMAYHHLGRGELRLGDVDLTRVALDGVVELRTAEPGRDVTVEIQPGMVVRGDLRLVQAALGKLLGNAWKFTSKRSGAQIQVGLVSVDGVPACFVRDNGVGFDMAYADRLFVGMRRLHTQDEFEGHGIGLISVNRVVQRHGGRAWVEAVEGVGATFFFTLESPHAPELNAASLPVGGGSGVHSPAPVVLSGGVVTGAGTQGES